MSLDVLALEIARLRVEVIDLERQSHDIGDDMAGAEALLAKLRLQRALGQYFDLSERLRARSCAAHAATPLSGCPECPPRPRGHTTS